jgi:hypothetical protein
MVGFFMAKLENYSSKLDTSSYRPEQFIVGTVVECNPSSFTVDVMVTGVEHYSSIPILGTYGGWQTRDISKLQKLRGAPVVLIYLEGQYHVLATLPMESTSIDKEVVTPLLDENYGGANSLTYDKSKYKIYQGGRPNDYFDSDKVIGTGDSLFGVFQGGIALLKASPLAQIILGKYKDFIRMIGRRFQIYSDFGEAHMEHTEEGRVRASIHGGADFRTESHPNVAKWTVQAWVGDDPQNHDNRLHIRVNDVENAEFVTLEMDIKGDMYLETSKTRNATHGKDENVDVKENRTLTIGQNQDETIGENLTTEIGQSRAETVGTDYTQDVGGAYSQTVGADASQTISGSYTQKVSGAGSISAGGGLTIKASGDITVQSSGNTYIN